MKGKTPRAAFFGGCFTSCKGAEEPFIKRGSRRGACWILAAKKASDGLCPCRASNCEFQRSSCQQSTGPTKTFDSAESKDGLEKARVYLDYVSRFQPAPPLLGSLTSPGSLHALHGRRRIGACYTCCFFAARSTIIFHCRRMAKAELTEFQLLEAQTQPVNSPPVCSLPLAGFQKLQVIPGPAGRHLCCPEAYLLSLIIFSW